MEKFLVWDKNNHTVHFDIVEEVFKNLNNDVDTITVEFFDNEHYIGEVDYSVEEFKDIYEEWLDK